MNNVMLTLLALLFSLTAAAGMDREDVIRNDVGAILKSYDSKATFHMKVSTYSSTGSKKSAIPFAPNSGSSSSGRSYIGKIEVKIIAENTSQLTKAKELIETYLENYTKNAKVSLVGLGTTSSANTKGETEYRSIIDLTPQWIIATTIGLSLLLVAFVVLISSRSSTKAISSLESTVAGIGQSVIRANTQQKNDANSNIQKLDTDGVAEFKRYVEGLKPESLREMMGDCYWTNNHQVAAFLWNSLWASHRSELTSESPWLSEYAEYLLSLSPKFDQRLYSPYFLSPLQLSHLEQSRLLDQVRDKPEVYSLISEFRSEALELTGEERIDLEINRGTTVAPVDRKKIMDQLKALPKGESKSFASGKMIPIHSVEDEQALLQREDLSIQVKMRIPTLSWLKQADKEQLSQKLRVYSAQDLANAWIGPDEVMSYLEEMIPEKKLKLLKSYREKIESPSRNHPVFRELVQFGIQALIKSTESEQHEPNLQNDAA